MKNYEKVCFTSVYCSPYSPGFSQSDKKSYFQDVGVFVGPGIGTVFGGESWKSGVCITAGIDSKLFSLDEVSSIIGGIGFQFHNVPWEESSDGYSYSGNSKFTHIILPILYHRSFDNKINVEGGVQPKFQISAKDKEDGQSYDEKDNYNAFNLAGVVGAEVQITDKVSAGLRLILDMFNMDNSDGMYYDKNSPDRSFSVMGVLRFSLWSSDND